MTQEEEPTREENYKMMLLKYILRHQNSICVHPYHSILGDDDTAKCLSCGKIMCLDLEMQTKLIIGEIESYSI